MATVQRHRVRIIHDAVTHTSTVSIDGRELRGVRRADVHLRAHDVEVVLTFGDECDIEIEADTQQIETRREGA